MDTATTKAGLHVERAKFPGADVTSVMLVDYGPPNHAGRPRFLATIDAETADRLRVQLGNLDWRTV